MKEEKYSQSLLANVHLLPEFNDDNNTNTNNNNNNNNVYTMTDQTGFLSPQRRKSDVSETSNTNTNANEILSDNDNDNDNNKDGETIKTKKGNHCKNNSLLSNMSIASSRTVIIYIGLQQKQKENKEIGDITQQLLYLQQKQQQLQEQQQQQQQLQENNDSCNNNNNMFDNDNDNDNTNIITGPGNASITGMPMTDNLHPSLRMSFPQGLAMGFNSMPMASGMYAWNNYRSYYNNNLPTLNMNSQSQTIQSMQSQKQTQTLQSQHQKSVSMNSGLPSQLQQESALPSFKHENTNNNNKILNQSLYDSNDKEQENKMVTLIKNHNNKLTKKLNHCHSYSYSHSVTSPTNIGHSRDTSPRLQGIQLPNTAIAASNHYRSVSNQSNHSLQSPIGFFFLFFCFFFSFFLF